MNTEQRIETHSLLQQMLASSVRTPKSTSAHLFWKCHFEWMGKHTHLHACDWCVQFIKSKRAQNVFFNENICECVLRAPFLKSTEQTSLLLLLLLLCQRKGKEETTLSFCLMNFAVKYNKTTHTHRQTRIHNHSHMVNFHFIYAYVCSHCPHYLFQKP